MARITQNQQKGLILIVVPQLRIADGSEFVREGFLLRVSLAKRAVKPCRIISCVYSTVRSEFKDFIQIKGQLLLTNLNFVAFMHW